MRRRAYQPIRVAWLHEPEPSVLAAVPTRTAVSHGRAWAVVSEEEQHQLQLWLQLQLGQVSALALMGHWAARS